MTFRDLLRKVVEFLPRLRRGRNNSTTNAPELPPRQQDPFFLLTWRKFGLRPPTAKIYKGKIFFCTKGQMLQKFRIRWGFAPPAPPKNLPPPSRIPILKMEEDSLGVRGWGYCSGEGDSLGVRGMRIPSVY